MSDGSPVTHASRRAVHPGWLKATAGLGLAAILALVFWLYLDPHFVVDLAGRWWSCL